MIVRKGGPWGYNHGKYTPLLKKTLFPSVIIHFPETFLPPLHDRRKNLRRVIPGIVHQFRDRPGLHQLRRVGREPVGKHLFVAQLRIQPVLVSTRSQDGRHAIMNCGHQFVRLGSDDRAALDLLSVGAFPEIPGPGKGKGLLILPRYVHGSFALTISPPLIKTIGNHQAALSAQQMLETRFLRQRFGSGIDHTRADGLILRPGWNKPPAQHTHMGGTILQNGYNILCWRDIITRLYVKRRRNAEALRDPSDIGNQREASTHVSLSFMITTP